MESRLPIALPQAPSLGECAEVADRLGQYELLEKLGAGGMGTVYRAMHSRLKRPAAIKVLRADRLEQPSSVSRFLGEMEAVGRLDHPNLVQAYDAGEADGRHFLVMELVVGADLRRLVGQLGPLRVSDACEVIAQAAQGLHHAHQHGLVHRDVKPSNLMVTREGTVKLLDLGIARLVSEEDGGSGNTVEDQILGSGDYLAPEQGEDARQANARSDIYALGCTLFYLLVGRAPFEDTRHNTLGRKLLAHSKERIPDIRRLRADLPNGLVHFLRRMLAKRPADRPDGMDEVEALVRTWATGADLSALIGRLSQRGCESSPGAQDNTPAWGPTATVGECPPLGQVMSTSGRLHLPVGSRLKRWGWLGLCALGLSVALGVWIARPEVPFAAPSGTSGPINLQTLVHRPAALPDTFGWTLETRGGRAAVTCMSVSPDERLLAVGDAVGCIRVLRLGTGDLTRILVEPGPIRAIAWLPNGRELAVASGALRIWEAESGRRLWETPLAEKEIATSLDCSCDGLLASGHSDGQIRLWQAGTRKLDKVLPGHADSVTALRFAGGGAQLASGDAKGALHIWRISDGTRQQQFENAETGPIRRLAWSPDATLLASCGGGNHVTIWDRADEFRPRREKAATQPVSGLGWSSDGQWFLAVSGGEQGMEFAVLWDGDVRIQKHRPLLTPNAATAIAWSHTAAVAYCGLSNGELQTYLPGSETTRVFRPAAATRTTTTAWAPDRPLLLTGDGSGWTRIWNLAEARQMDALRASDHPVSVLAWHPQGKRFAVGHVDGVLALADAATGRIEKTIACNGHVQDAAFSPCGKWVATAEEHSLCRIWNTETGTEQWQFPLDHSSVVNTVAWSPDGRYLAFSAWDARVRLVSMDQGEIVQQWDSGHGCLWYMLWEPEGHILLTSGASAGIAHWNALTATLLLREDGSLREASMLGNALGSARVTCASRSLRGIAPDGSLVAERIEGNLLALHKPGGSESRLLICGMRQGHWLAIQPDSGHYQANLSPLETPMYVVATAEGEENLTPAEFAARYQWQNRSDQVGIKSP